MFAGLLQEGAEDENVLVLIAHPTEAEAIKLFANTMSVQVRLFHQPEYKFHAQYSQFQRDFHQNCLNNILLLNRLHRLTTGLNSATHQMIF